MSVQAEVALSGGESNKCCTEEYQEVVQPRACRSPMEFTKTEIGDPVSLATDAVTREWDVEVLDTRTGVCKRYHVTVADYTSVNPDAPRIVLGVNGVRWSVEVHYGFSAYPLCGPPCTYTWQMDGHTFELALDAISLRTWRGGLLLFVNGREAQSNHSKPFFWFRRFVIRALIGLLWIAAGFAIHLVANRLSKGEENLHHVLIVLLFLGLSMITMVMVLPCAIGLSYFVVGCLGVFKFGLANVLSRADDQAHSTSLAAPPRKRNGAKKTKAGAECYVILEEDYESPYAVTSLRV